MYSSLAAITSVSSSESTCFLKSCMRATLGRMPCMKMVSLTVSGSGLSSLNSLDSLVVVSIGMWLGCAVENPYFSITFSAYCFWWILISSLPSETW